MTNTVYRVYSEKLGGSTASTFIGNSGDLFFDPATGALRLSDGTTQGGTDPAGIPVTPNDYPVTNNFYVDAKRTDSYTATGSIIKPFLTIAAAQAAIEARIAAATLLTGEANPIFIVIQSSITENVTLTRGHVFLVSNQGTIHTPIYLSGTVTVNGSNSTTSALDTNHFAIAGLAIVAPTQKAAIHFTGANAQRLMVKDLWLTASGNQTGTTPLTDAGGYGILADNTGVRASDGKLSTIHGSDVKVSHTGTGDVYCFRISKGTADFANVETSGATQVASVSSGAALAFATSELNANGDVCIEAYGTGTLTVTNSSITNSAANSNGIRLNQTGSTAIIGNVAFQVPTGTGRAVYGVAGSVLLYGSLNFIPMPNGTASNKVISTAITPLAIPSTFTTG